MRDANPVRRLFDLDGASATFRLEIGRGDMDRGLRVAIERAKTADLHDGLVDALRGAPIAAPPPQASGRWLN